jgi:hypothetical protein
MQILKRPIEDENLNIPYYPQSVQKMHVVPNKRVTSGFMPKEKAHQICDDLLRMLR